MWVALTPKDILGFDKTAVFDACGIRERWTFNATQKVKPKNDGFKIATNIKQYLLDTDSLKSEGYSLHKSISILLDCIILSGVAIASTTPYRYDYEGHYNLS